MRRRALQTRSRGGAEETLRSLHRNVQAGSLKTPSSALVREGSAGSEAGLFKTIARATKKKNWKNLGANWISSIVAPLPTHFRGLGLTGISPQRTCYANG